MAMCQAIKDTSFFLTTDVLSCTTSLAASYLARYNRKEVIKDSAHFPVVGEISEKDIVELILGKVKKNDLS